MIHSVQHFGRQKGLWKLVYILEHVLQGNSSNYRNNYHFRLSLAAVQTVYRHTDEAKSGPNFMYFNL